MNINFPCSPDSMDFAAFFMLWKIAAFPQTKKKTPFKNSLYFRKWNFIAAILKNMSYFLIFSQKKSALRFLKMKPFTSNVEKKKKNKNLVFSQKKPFLIFSQKRAFLIFPKTEPCTFQPNA